jgi:transposase-like protein
MTEDDQAAGSAAATENDKAMGEVIQIDRELVQKHLSEVVRSTVEQTLNAMLDAEADQLCGAKRYEHSADRIDTRAGHYERSLQTKAGEVTLKVPKLRKLPFETAIIERYRRRETSVEEALIEMYHAGVSVRRVEDITEALWGTRVSPSTVSELNQKIAGQIEQWRSRPIEGEHPYVYLDGLWLKRSWGGEVKNVSVLIAIGVNQDGFREVLAVSEGTKEDKASWQAFLRQLKSRGLKGVRLMVGDRCLGLVESIAEFYPEAAYQRCVVHFYRNVWSFVPATKVRTVAQMLKAIHACEDRPAAEEKTRQVVTKLREMKLPMAAEHVQQNAPETFGYFAFPAEHWRNLRTNNPLERVIREVRRRTRVVGAFPDGNSALILVCARLRHIASKNWGGRRYMDMDRLRHQAEQTEPSLSTPAC